jgi:membrane protein implicated in regulation of membrane protease activity
LTIAWIAVAVVLLAVELHHGAFYALFASVGCLAAAIVAFLAPGMVPVQVLAAIAVSALGILVVRPRVTTAFAHRREGYLARGVHGGFVGQEVVTLDVVGGPDQVGHVRLAGESWRAVSGADQPIPSGTTVVVTAVEGTTLVVWPADGYLPPEVHHDDAGELWPDDGGKEQA